MNQIETLKKLRKGLIESDVEDMILLNPNEALAIIECLPELLAAKEERDALLSQVNQTKAKNLFAVYTEFDVDGDTHSYACQNVEVISANDPNDACDKALDLLKAHHHNPTNVKQIASKYVPSN